MTWTSQFNATFTKPLIRQLMAIVQRDQRAALDFAGGIVSPAAGALPSIVSYQLAPLTIPQFPAILIAPMDSAFDHDAIGSLHYVDRVYCAVAVANQDAQILAELAQGYVAALDAIFNTLSLGQPGLADLYTALPLTLPSIGTISTAPLAVGSVKEIFVQSHNYDEIRRPKTGGFACVATLALVIDREET